jgi:hypothetical protein
MVVHNRNYNGTWLWVLPEKQHWHCWVSANVVKVEGDIFSVTVYFHPLPKSTLYAPPKWVNAVRQGNEVLVTWDEVRMTVDDDRGYLIEARICRNGYLLDVAVHTMNHSYTLIDEHNCDGDSYGKVYAVEKHGYTDPVPIPWP